MKSRSECEVRGQKVGRSSRESVGKRQSHCGSVEHPAEGSSSASGLRDTVAEGGAFDDRVWMPEVNAAITRER